MIFSPLNIDILHGCLSCSSHGRRKEGLAEENIGPVPKEEQLLKISRKPSISHRRPLKIEAVKLAENPTADWLLVSSSATERVQCGYGGCWSGRKPER